MGAKKSLILLFLLIACSLALSLTFRNNLGLSVRVFNDPSDIGIYKTEGLWFVESKIPYKEVFSEYPQVAMYFFAVPHIVQSWIDPQGQTAFDYAVLHSLFMSVFLGLSIVVLSHLLDRPNRALLLLLPASFYFARNRYDIMPCFVGLLSLFLFHRQKYTLSAAALAVGVLTKWTLLLVLPVYLACYFTKHKKISWSMIAAFCLTSAVILMPTLISGGIEGLLVPYRHHWTTGINEDSLLYLLDYGLSRAFKFHVANSTVIALFFVLQFFMVPLCLSARIGSLEKVAKWSALSTLVFMLFAKFNSPQWILWITPFLVITARSKADIAWIILLDLSAYAWFPVGFDAFGAESTPYLLVIWLKTLIWIALIIRLSLGLLKDNLLIAFVQRQLTLAHSTQP